MAQLQGLDKFKVDAGGGGSNIKSIQRGSIGFTDTSFWDNMTAVDIDASIIKHTSTCSAGAAYYSRATSKLLSSTQFSFERGASNASYPVLMSWEVIEFNNVKSKQTGQTTLNSTTKEINITISDVDLSKSFLTISFKSDSSTTSVIPVSARLTTSTNLYLKLDDMGGVTVGNVTVEYQIIEFI